MRARRVSLRPVIESVYFSQRTFPSSASKVYTPFGAFALSLNTS